MKKLAIAAAVAAMATMASAQQVEVYGKMRVYQERDTVGTATAVTKQTNDSSRLGFRGTEDLGGGLKAFFTLETGVAADAPSASTLGDRTSVVGINSSQWRVALGRDKHQIARVLDNFDAIENGFGTTVGTIHNAQSSRFNNAAFISVSPIKNVTAHYQHSSSETAGTKATTTYGVDATFGTVSVSAAQFDNNQTGASKNASTIVGAKLALGSGGTTLFGIYSDDEASGVKTSGKTVGIQQQVTGPIKVMASYGEKQAVDAYALGASYALSKRTSLHARYRNEDSTTNSSDRKQFGLGVEHNF